MSEFKWFWEPIENNKALRVGELLCDDMRLACAGEGMLTDEDKGKPKYTFTANHFFNVEILPDNSIPNQTRSQNTHLLRISLLLHGDHLA